MTEELKQKLVSLANKYEVPSFCDADPSQFLRWYDLSQVADVECASFIAAMLAFGNRKQFIPKIKEILTTADTTLSAQGKPLGISAWCCAGAPNFPTGEKKFYRFYSYNDMHCLFSELAAIVEKKGSLGEYFREGKAFHLADQIATAFPESAIVPKGTASANKRVHMFLRWMVRQNSPVDLGLWNWADQSKLLIPLDVHVMQEGVNLGLLPENATASYKTAVNLTSAMNEVFPGDPSRADFALFGLGVDK